MQFLLAIRLNHTTGCGSVIWRMQHALHGMLCTAGSMRPQGTQAACTVGRITLHPPAVAVAGLDAAGLPRAGAIPLGVAARMCCSLAHTELLLYSCCHVAQSTYYI